jgi:hypothetical protein
MTWNDLIKSLQSFPPELLDKDVQVRTFCYSCNGEDSTQVFPDVLNQEKSPYLTNGLYLE